MLCSKPLASLPVLAACSRDHWTTLQEHRLWTLPKTDSLAPLPVKCLVQSWAFCCVSLSA